MSTICAHLRRKKPPYIAKRHLTKPEKPAIILSPGEFGRFALKREINKLKIPAA